MTLRVDHSEQLAKLRILPAVIEAARVEAKNDSEIRGILGINGQYRGCDLSGLFFPSLSPIDGRRVGGRHRLDHPLEDQKIHKRDRQSPRALRARQR